jgi:hypothetical protein
MPINESELVAALEEKLVKIIAENDRLREELDQNRETVASADTAVKSRINVYLA